MGNYQADQMRRCLIKNDANISRRWPSCAGNLRSPPGLWPWSLHLGNPSGQPDTNQFQNQGGFSVPQGEGVGMAGFQGSPWFSSNRFQRASCAHDGAIGVWGMACYALGFVGLLVQLAIAFISRVALLKTVRNHAPKPLPYRGRNGQCEIPQPSKNKGLGLPPIG